MGKGRLSAGVLLCAAVAAAAAARAEELGPAENPFGVMASGAQRLELAGTLGVGYYRPPAVFIKAWNGAFPECEAAAASGLRIALTVRNSAGPGEAAVPPEDLGAYARTLGEILDACRPALLVVENEENSRLFYDGSPTAYLDQLSAACAVAHERDLPCANGGLVSSLVAGLVADHYGEEEPERAEEYLERALKEKARQLASEKGKLRADQQIAKGRALLAGYRGAGSDYVNFHWYVEDARALEEAVAFLESATGLRALTNEIGQQRNESPEQVRDVLGKAAELRLPLIVWFSQDVHGFGGARALAEPGGGLRPNGEAFRDFIKQWRIGR